MRGVGKSSAASYIVWLLLHAAAAGRPDQPVTVFGGHDTGSHAALMLFKGSSEIMDEAAVRCASSAAHYALHRLACCATPSSSAGSGGGGPGGPVPDRPDMPAAFVNSAFLTC